MLTSTLKPLGKSVTLRGVDTDKGKIVKENHPATGDSGRDRRTVAVMGGEDWQMWIDALHE
ncbi:trans-2-enoyl-CoA reductase, partial [Klebsiella quasipneumoniae]